ncbi:MAG: DegT/DnrJ/EryC1/StrS family aminotransferase [Candidatus Diapherotrites archaeon]
MKIPVANTSLNEDDARAAYETVKSQWLSMGPRVKEFEENFCKCTGAKNAVAVNNGTSALHTALVALGIGHGDEVILPTLTFISTANVVLYQGAKPVLAECDKETYNITADEIRKRITAKTKAVISVDMNGMPADYDEITELCEKKGIALVADSAESLGATYKKRRIGSIAPLHCFSFFPNKNITTGEGGMVTTGDAELAEKMRKIRNQGQEGRYRHVMLGNNYRMTDLQAAVGNSQLARLDSVISEKQGLADEYYRALEGVKGLELPHIPDYVTQHAWYLYTVNVDAKKRDIIVEGLAKEGIETRLSFPPIHAQPYYAERYGYGKADFPVSYSLWKSLIDIPLWCGMGKEKQEIVVSHLKKILGRA